MDLSLLMSHTLNGLVLGSMYSLFACGLTLIWGTMNLLNFAHGEYYMLGGYVFYFALALGGVPPWVGVLITIAVVFLAGVFTERMVIHFLLDKPGWDVSPFVATLGISIFLQNFALKIWGERFKSVPYLIDGTLDIHGIRLAYQRVLILIVAAVAIGAFWLLMKKTRFGMALRATAQNREAASLIGINFYNIYMGTFGISTALAALSAVMLAPIVQVHPWMGVPIILKAFVVAVLGGLGSYEGAIVGGLVVGLMESLAVVVLSSEWKEVFSFGLLIVVLATRPSGFFGKREL
jgi:branched-chain amino acid transport system permease protein